MDAVDACFFLYFVFSSSSLLLLLFSSSSSTLMETHFWSLADHAWHIYSELCLDGSQEEIDSITKDRDRDRDRASDTSPRRFRA